MTHSLMLYFLFLKISLFTFGGGYAMIPLFQSELVDNRQLLTAEEFADMIALAQMTPGPVGLNAATYVGYQQAGIVGAIAGTLGVATPSLVLMTLAAAFLAAFRNNPVLQALLNGIRPATIGLIAAAVIFFANLSIFTAPLQNLLEGSRNFGLDWRSCVIFSAVLFAQWKWKTNIFALLGGSVLLAWILFRF